MSKCELSLKVLQIANFSQNCRRRYRKHLCRRRIMVSLEYLPYYCKLFNHIWQLYTLGVGKFFHMLKFDLSSLSRSHDQKIVFSGTPARHRSSGKSTDRRGL